MSWAILCKECRKYKGDLPFLPKCECDELS